MRSRPKHFRFITTTLLLSLTCALQLPGKTLGISCAIAAKLAQDTEAELEKLSLERFPLLNRMPLQIAGNKVVPGEKLTPEETLKKLQQKLVIHRNDGDRIGEADTLNQIGEVYIRLKEYQKSLESQQ